MHRLVALMRPMLEGRLLVGGHAAAYAKGRPGPGPERAFDGRRVDEVFARGKHLFFRFGVELLRTHLGMYGSWHGYRPGEPWKKPARDAGVVFETEGDVLVCFHPRDVEWLRRASPHARAEQARIGPDLVSAELDLGAVFQRARSLLEPGTPLVDLLLDQRIASGIGNVYKSEVLFLERRAPQSPIGALGVGELVRLYQCASELLRANVEEGHSGRRVTVLESTRRVAPAQKDRLWVYKRAGRPCLRCDRAIVTGRLGPTPAQYLLVSVLSARRALKSRRALRYRCRGT